MKGIYLASYKALHENHNIIYQDINGERDLDGDMLDIDLSSYDYIIATPPCNYWSRANNKIAPLYECKITEEQALNICYKHKIYFDRLYTFLKRVSCWCCRNKNLKELENYKKYLPEYYKKLIELEEKIGEPMKKPYYLKDRFKGE